METPKKSPSNLSGNMSTPFKIPASPFLETLGYGTGIEVMRVNRVNTAASPWAVKRVNKTVGSNKIYHQRLRVEADILRQLKHPNIVGFRAFNTMEDGREFLAMEDCSRSLGDIIEDRLEQDSGPMPAPKIKRMIFDITSALNYLHSEVFMLHGDIKSYNILVKNDYETYKLCDFGVSLTVTPDGFLDTKGNSQQEYIGTPLWAAPEVHDNGLISTKTDMFSFGMVIYETIALCPPHTLSLKINEDVSLKEDEEESLERSLTDYMGTRPEIPDIYELSEEYNKILEVFFTCTNEFAELRPSAKIINDSFAS